MPTLEWIGKKKIINHHRDVPFRVLNKEYTFNADESENMIIHGDNLEALKALLPKYAGEIKVVYIDPPYNTGKPEGKWVYSDNVDDPRIRKWLGEVVGPEGEDLSRHDKWLCMMYPRLKLLRELMSEDGVIFISIDDNELFHLKLICDEIFGITNYINTLSVEINPKGRKNSDFISQTHDYCLIYAKDKRLAYFKENIPKNAKDLTPDEKGRLVHNSGKRVLVGENSFNKVVEDFNSDKHYSVYYNKELDDMIMKKEYELNEIDEELISQEYVRYISFNNNEFVENTYTMDRFQELFDNDAIDFKDEKLYEKNFSTTIRMKSILSNNEYKVYDNNNNIIKYKIDVKTTSAGTELKNMFKTKKPVFDNSKNKMFIKLLISLIDDKNCTVLDCFAGSGTTGHAVLDLNNDDGGKRKFIEIEMMDYAERITARRTKIAIDGYGDVEPLKGDFSFYTLGEKLFDENGYLNEDISEEKIRQYIYYTETKQEQIKDPKNKYFLGTKDLTDYYLYYEKEKETSLNYDFLSTIKKKNEIYIIYADKCTISDDDLDKLGITFKKIPRDISRL